MPVSAGGNPFDEGMDAFGRGIERSECPYPENSDEREEWLEGWDQAKHHAQQGTVSNAPRA